MTQADVAIRGAGVVGQCLALSLARQGLQVALVGAKPLASSQAGTSCDVRAYALNAASVSLLRQLKVWEALPAARVTPVHDMRIEGDAPGASLQFSSWQQGSEALAWIVDVPALEQVLAEAIRYAPHINCRSESADEPAVIAPLSALCEGKGSSSRQRLGVQMSQQAYGQQAIAARLVCAQPHLGTARQWFGSPEVLALLPMDAPQAGHTVALVWSVSDERASFLRDLTPEAFEQTLLDATQGALGSIRLVSERQAWPLVRSQAQSWCGPGWVLLGDAAHGVHPLAGQGLNLGLADVACLSQVLARRETWRPLGDDKLLRRYARARAVPTWAMSQGIDGLWQLFAAPGAGARELRNRGMTLVNRLTSVKRWIASQALGG